MQIDGVVHLLFEQSGTFKKEFISRGYKAMDYDIRNRKGQTDVETDLFVEIDNAYDGKSSVFDGMTTDDLIIAFYPCIYFENMSQMLFSPNNVNYTRRNLSIRETYELILEREAKRSEFYRRLYKFVCIIQERGLRMVMENPWAMQHYLKGNFVQAPNIVDTDRTRRGDRFVKPTGYWFFNCEPSYGFTIDQTPENEIGSVRGCAPEKEFGICNEERSTITPKYAGHFIDDNILGVTEADRSYWPLTDQEKKAARKARLAKKDLDA